MTAVHRLAVIVDLAVPAGGFDLEAAAMDLEVLVRDHADFPGQPDVQVDDVGVYDRGPIASGLPEDDDAAHHDLAHHDLAHHDLAAGDDGAGEGRGGGGLAGALAVVVAARGLIAERASWCTGVPARDAAGAEVAPEDPQAVAWCASAALDRAAHDLAACWEVSHLACRALEDATVRLHGHYLPQEVNDDPGRGHAAVVELYDAAIADLTAAAPTPPAASRPLVVVADECAALLAAAGGRGAASADLTDVAAVLDRARATVATLGEES